MLDNIKKVDKKIIIMCGVLLTIIFIFVIAVIVIKITSNGSISFDQIENKLSEAAENYSKDNGSVLPNKVGETVEISSEKLVSGGYIKDLSNYTEEGVSCSGIAYITKTYAGYDYIGVIDCGKSYKTEFLYEKLIKSASENNDNRDGLYKMETVVTKGESLGVDEDGYDLSSNELMSGYIFRGDNVNNYIKLDDVLYRIVKIDGNNDFVLSTSVKQENVVFDNRYNSESNSNEGINDYKKSRIYDSLASNYKLLKTEGMVKQKGITKNICIGARSANDIATDGSIECSKVLKDQYYSLIPVFDVMNASLSDECKTTTSKACMNYNYLIMGSSFWSQTPSTSNSYTVFEVGNGISSAKASNSNRMKHVYYLTSKLVYVSGNGTKTDPYIVK